MYITRTIVILSMAALVTAPANAQFDVGVSAGWALVQLRAVESDDPHLSTTVDDIGRTAFTASAFYRERYSDFVDLGLELVFLRQSFNAGYGYSGLGGGHAATAHVELDQIHIGVKPEVRMDAKRMAVVRFGLHAGMRIGGSARGSTYTWSMAGPGTRNDAADLIGDFGGDFRFAFGFGFRIPAGQRWAITIDPEATFGLTSLLHAQGNILGSNLGLRVGLSRRSQSKALTGLFKAPPRNPDEGPAW